MFKCCYLPEKLGKHEKFVTFFVYTIDEFSHYLPQAHAVKTRACVLRFSVLNALSLQSSSPIPGIRICSTELFYGEISEFTFEYNIRKTFMTSKINVY